MKKPKPNTRTSAIIKIRNLCKIIFIRSCSRIFFGKFGTSVATIPNDAIESPRSVAKICIIIGLSCSLR